VAADRGSRGGGGETGGVDFPQESNRSERVAETRDGRDKSIGDVMSYPRRSAVKIFRRSLPGPRNRMRVVPRPSLPMWITLHPNTFRRPCERSGRRWHVAGSWAT